MKKARIASTRGGNMFGQNTNDQSQPTDQNTANPVLANSAPPAGFNPGGFQPQQPQPQTPDASTTNNDPMNLTIPNDATGPDAANTPQLYPAGAPAVPSMADPDTQVPNPAADTPAPSNDPITPPAPSQTEGEPSNESPMIMDTNPTDFGVGSTPEESSDTQQIPTTPSEPANASDLLSMKQTALQELQPLVGHLDQSPEEKFRTLMMMIQASDDHTKLNEAFDLAKQISDEKIRAQALLDVINEINYFTQQSQNN